VKSQNEETLLEEFEKMPKHQLKDSAKQRMLSEIEKQKEQSKSHALFPRWIGSTAAAVVAAIIVAGGIYGVSNHEKPVSSHYTTASTAMLQAETSFYQRYVDQMTPVQKYKLHQLLTRDTQISDLWIYDGNTDSTLVVQMESDFKEFQNLFPHQMASIQAGPVSVYEKTDPSALSPFVADDLTSFLSKIYLAYEAAIWNMGDPNSNLYSFKLAQIVKRPNVPGVFSQWNRVFFGGKIDVNSLTENTSS